MFKYLYIMISKVALLVVVFIGLILITVNIVNYEQKPQEKVVEYRYIPRTLEEEQAEPVYVSDIFKTMFSQQSPWIFSVQDIDRKKQEAVNKFFISQY
jgi:hypothetical protein